MKAADRSVDHGGQAIRTVAPVSVIITCYNHGCWLGDAIASVAAQTCRPAETIVVDDGSTDDTARVCERFPQARYVFQANAGLAAARNTGLRHATGRYVCFLDADDLLLPNALEAGLAALTEHPDWAFAYGGYAVITAGRRWVRTVNAAPGEVGYRAFLKSNRVGMHATVLYRRSALEQVGGFDTKLRSSEDYDIMLRIARTRKVGSHGAVVAEYRQHGSNMSRDAERMLISSLAVLHGQEGEIRCQHDRAALDAGIDHFKRYYGAQLIQQALLELPRPSRTLSALRRLDFVRRSAPQAFVSALWGGPRSIARSIWHRLPRPVSGWARKARDRAAGKPAKGSVAFGHLRRLKPIDSDFGYGRGLPIDRFYIEHFLERHADDVKGHVLEVEEDRYTTRIGQNRVGRVDIVNISPDDSNTTIVADLADAPNIADESFDCIILTQTLQYIYDTDRAVETLRRILKPDGVLLLTVPGLSKLDRDERRYGWYWLFTAAAVRRMLGAGWADVSVETYGNVLSSVSFLHGLAADELARDELLTWDEEYQVIVAARAVRGGDAKA